MQRLTYAMMKAAVAKKQAGDAQPYILDVRGTDEVANGAIPSSVNVPLDQLESALKMSAEEFKSTYSATKPATGDHVVTYCMRGMRAEKAAAALQSGGYTNVDVYPGSWAEWSEHEKQSQ